MGNTPKPRFLEGTERSVTYGRYRQSSRQEEEGPPPEGGGATVNLSAPSFSSVRGPAQSGPVMSGGKLPRAAGGPRNGRRQKHFVQVGKAVPRPGRSGLAVQVGRSEPSAAESGGGGEDRSRRTQASSSRLGHQEDQPVSAADVVSTGEPGDGSPDVT